MAHILELQVSRLAGRESTFAATLNHDVNVFYGLNGSGKTSLLKILHSALSGETSILRHVPFEHAEVKIYSIDLKKQFTRTISQLRDTPQGPIQPREAQLAGFTTERSGEEATKSPAITWKTTPSLPRGVAGSWRHQYLPTSRLYLSPRSLAYRYSAIDPTTASLFSEEYLDRLFAEMIQSLWSSYSAQLLSAVRMAQEDGLASILKAVLAPKQQRARPADLDVKVAYDRLRAFLKRQGSPTALGSLDNFGSSYQTDPQLRRIVSDIDGIERRIEDATKPRERLRALISDMYSSNKHVEFTDTSITVSTADNAPIGLQDLSSGEKQLLRLFIETLMASDCSVLIDEPEISVHVDWQRRLVESMRQLNGSAQLVMATHSPELMADLPDAQVFRL